MKRAACFAIVLSLCACVTPDRPPRPPRPPVPQLKPKLPKLLGKLVEVDVGAGQKLRGLFVPPPEGEDLFLHFLGAPIAATARQASDTQILVDEFEARGAGSLVLDMRGIGSSDGVCDPRNVPADALAAWTEALRLVGGKSERVIVRGISLGNLWALSLLEQGIRPELVLFIAPVGKSAAAECWRQAFGVDAVAPGENSSGLGFDLARIPSSNKLTGNHPFVFLRAPDGSLQPEELTEMFAEAKRVGVIVMDDELDNRSPVLAAFLPYKNESDYFLPRRAYNRSGFCALKYPLDIHIIHPVPSFAGREVLVSPEGSVERSESRDQHPKR